MSKRHTFDNTGLDPTLVFWAPLDEGDFYDHISGIEMQRNTGTITWDVNLGAYHFQQASNNLNVAGYWDGLNLDIDIVNWGFTMVADYAAAYNGTGEYQYRSIDIGGLVSTNNNAARCLVQPNIHRANYSTTTGEMHRLAVKCATDGQGYLFANGYRNNQWATPVSLVSSWSGVDNVCNVFKRDTNVSNDWVKTRVSIGRAQGSNQITNIWVKNIRIYNRELTINEIIAL